MVQFSIYKDLKKVNANSLLIDSGEEVASLQIGKYWLSLMCRGEVRVNFGDETFYSASEYPQIVTDYFLGKITEEEINKEKEFWIGDNNWFQLELLKHNENENDIAKYDYVNRVNDYLDIADIEGSLESETETMGTMLYKIMVEELINMKNHFEEELKDLDLSNL